MPQDNAQEAEFIRLYKLSLIPLRVVLPSLVWVLYDYFLTVEDEVRYVWPQKRSFGRFMFFWIRYYTIVLLIFDAVQIHTFARKGVPNLGLCLAMDPTIRIVGAVSLWSVEIIMQVRIYALFDRSKKIALYNAIFFAISILAFVGLLVDSGIHRKVVIASAVQLPLPGCPTINGGIRWAVWVPASIFELNLLALALYKSVTSTLVRVKLNGRVPLLAVLLQDNILYFLGVSVVLVMNNIMAVGTAAIPWFGYGPFHAALGIMTSRMHIHLTKFLEHEVNSGDKIVQSSDIRLSIPSFGSFSEASTSTISADTLSLDLDLESVAESSNSYP